MSVIALACNPRLLVADAPATALGVTTQAQILHPLRNLGRRISPAIVLITHDPGAVAEMVGRVVIIDAGRKLEEGAVKTVLTQRRHPCTQGLQAAAPRRGSSISGPQSRRFDIPGTVLARIDGCAFAARCPIVADICRKLRLPAMTSPGREAVARRRGPLHRCGEGSRRRRRILRHSPQRTPCARW